MRMIITLFGLLTFLGGIWPLIKDMGFVPESLKFIPSTGLEYQLIIIIIGVTAMIYGVRKKDY